MRIPSGVFLGTLLLLSSASTALADPGTPLPAGPVCSVDAAVAGRWAVSFGTTALPAGPFVRGLSLALPQAPAPRRVVAVEYSEAYKVRAKIHKIASFATLPVFAATYWVGQDLYDHPGESDSKKGLHSGLAATTGVLFGVNTVTGVWNLWEGRKDPNHRGRRMTHGILMLIADAGFVATGMLAPESEYENGSLNDISDQRSTHRTVALASMGVATASYLLMLFWGN